jgi:hypothetical protein
MAPRLFRVILIMDIGRRVDGKDGDHEVANGRGRGGKEGRTQREPSNWQVPVYRRRDCPFVKAHADYYVRAKIYQERLARGGTLPEVLLIILNQLLGG